MGEGRLKELKVDGMIDFLTENDLSEMQES